MPKNKMCGLLEVRDLALQVNLGWTAMERKRKQKILLGMHIQFENEPKACLTDELKDTVCYDTLIKKIRAGLAGNQYRLIEHLAAEIYQIARSGLPKNIRLWVSLDKYPKIKGLSGGVRFTYGG